MKQNSEENKKAGYGSASENSAKAGEGRNTANSAAVNQNSTMSQEKSAGSDMYPSSQNLSESGKKEDQPRGSDPTKSSKKSEEGKGWAIDGRDHIET